MFKFQTARAQCVTDEDLSALTFISIWDNTVIFKFGSRNFETGVEQEYSVSKHIYAIILVTQRDRNT